MQTALVAINMMGETCSATYERTRTQHRSVFDKEHDGRFVIRRGDVDFEFDASAKMHESGF